MDHALRLLVGCPVAHREWILPDYLDHVEKSCTQAGLALEYLFVLGPDDPSRQAIAENTDRVVHEVLVDEPRTQDVRDWHPARYRRMVELRNILLARARELDAAAFLSLDSDILLHPDTVSNLVETLGGGRFDAVGGACFMTSSGVLRPSMALLTRQGSMYRPFTPGAVCKVDVIMAIKLLSWAAMRVEYAPDHLGEDIGWSKAARSAGLCLGWDARVVNKHVLNPEHLHRHDARCGF